MTQSIALPGVEFLAPVDGSRAEVLTPEAIAFLVDLQTFGREIGSFLQS